VREAHRLDVLPGQPRAIAVERCVDKWKKGDRGGLLRGYVDSLRWIESPTLLPVTVSISLESVPEELQVIMKALVVTQGSGPMYERGKNDLLFRSVVVGFGMEIEVGVCVDLR
jgi:hypothetical protein